MDHAVRILSGALLHADVLYGHHCLGNDVCSVGNAPTQLLKSHSTRGSTVPASPEDNLYVGCRVPVSMNVIHFSTAHSRLMDGSDLTTSIPLLKNTMNMREHHSAERLVSM